VIAREEEGVFVVVIFGLLEMEYKRQAGIVAESTHKVE
jgi:hypothetical protein